MAWFFEHGGLPLLAAARGLGLALTAAAWGGSSWGLDWRTRLMLAVLAAVLAATGSGSAAATDEPPATTIGEPSVALEHWGVLLPLELVYGGVLGLGTGWVVAAARRAGDLLAVQAGLSPDVWLAPNGDDPDASPLGRLHGWTAVAIFITLDGPLALTRALWRGLRQHPPGTWWNAPLSTEPLADLLAVLLNQICHALTLCLELAAIPAAALIVAAVGLAWTARALPHVGALAATMPLRFAAVVAALLLTSEQFASSILAAFRAGLGS
jgi:type III secretory pathway component EscT